MDNTRIEEIENFFKLFQITIVLRNKNGFKVSSNKTVLDASIVEKVKAQSIDNDVKTIVAIAKNPLYSEKDWIKRILGDAIYRSKDNEDKDIVLNNINNKLFDYLNECFRYSNWNSVNLLRKLPKLPMENKMSDKDVYDYFGLTGDDVNRIEEMITWR